MPPNRPYNEREILALIAKGDEQAFAELMTQHYPLCYQIALKMLRDPWMAEDVAQEVFLKIWLRRTGLTEIENFGGWLRTATANHLYNYLRKSHTDQAHITEWWKNLSLPERQGEELPTKEETYYEELIAQALGLLTPRQKQAFTLIKQQGYTREEAAQIMGIGTESVKSHLEQAMRSVRAYCIGRLDSSSLLVIFYLLQKKYF